MPASAQSRNAKPEFAETFDNTGFVSTTKQAVGAVVDRIRDSGMPIHLKGMYGQLLYYCAIDHCDRALRSLGYKVINVSNQLRLNAKTAHGRDILIRFAGGRVIGETINFRWPKGAATRVGVEANGRYVGSPLSPTLWEQGTIFENMDNSFNLWVIADPTPQEFVAWLAFPTQWNSNTSLYCSRTIELCRMPIDQALIDIIIPTSTSDYVIDFDDLQTGTND